MLIRAIVIWLALLVVAVLNGTIREALISPRAGQSAAHAISTLILSMLILLLSWFTVPWIAPDTLRRAFLVGVLWVALTLTFEFLAGHYLFGHSWQRLLADYNLLAGRIWILVPIITLMAPLLIQNIRAQM